MEIVAVMVVVVALGLPVAYYILQEKPWVKVIVKLGHLSAVGLAWIVGMVVVCAVVIEYGPKVLATIGLFALGLIAGAPWWLWFMPTILLGGGSGAENR